MKHLSIKAVCEKSLFLCDKNKPGPSAPPVKLVKMRTAGDPGGLFHPTCTSLVKEKARIYESPEERGK